MALEKRVESTQIDRFSEHAHVAVNKSALSKRQVSRKRVFLSFVHEDQEVASAVQRFLKKTLRLDNVFMSSDRAQVFAGESWLDVLKQSMHHADVVVLMLSRRSIDRAWVNFEAGAAWVTDTPIIPCCYGKITKAKLPQPYSGLQALDLPDDTEYLLASVAHHLRLPPPRWVRAFSVLNKPIIRVLDGFKDVEE